MTAEEKNKILEDKIKSMIKESLELEAKEDSTEEKDKEDDERVKSGEDRIKRQLVKTWLDSAMQLHSVLAYRLWPKKAESDARALFSKKYNGKDSDGNSYSFSANEINTLYNMRNDEIKKSELKRNAHKIKESKTLTISESELKTLISEAIQSVLK